MGSSGRPVAAYPVCPTRRRCQEGVDLVVDRSATGSNSGAFGGQSVDGCPAQRTRPNAVDDLKHLAKVRVAGSNPVFRSNEIPGQSQIGVQVIGVQVIGNTCDDSTVQLYSRTLSAAQKAQKARRNRLTIDVVSGGAAASSRSPRKRGKSISSFHGTPSRVEGGVCRAQSGDTRRSRACSRPLSSGGSRKKTAVGWNERPLRRCGDGSLPTNSREWLTRAKPEDGHDNPFGDKGDDGLGALRWSQIRSHTSEPTHVAGHRGALHCDGVDPAGGPSALCGQASLNLSDPRRQVADCAPSYSRSRCCPGGASVLMPRPDLAHDAARGATRTFSPGSRHVYQGLWRLHRSHSVGPRFAAGRSPPER